MFITLSTHRILGWNVTQQSIANMPYKIQHLYPYTLLYITFIFFLIIMIIWKQCFIIMFPYKQCPYLSCLHAQQPVIKFFPSGTCYTLLPHSFKSFWCLIPALVLQSSQGNVQIPSHMRPQNHLSNAFSTTCSSLFLGYFIWYRSILPFFGHHPGVQQLNSDIIYLELVSDPTG